MLSNTRLPAAVLLLLQLLAVPVRADSLYSFDPPAQQCAMAMLDIYGNYEWPGIYYGNYYGALCQEPNVVISFYAALYTYCTEKEIEVGTGVVEEYCLAYGLVNLTSPSVFAANLTKEAIASLPVLHDGDLVEDSNVTFAFIMDRAWFELAYKTEQAWDEQERHHALYTLAGIVFWSIVVFFGMVQNAVGQILERRRGYVYPDAEGNGAAPSRGSGSPGFFGRVVGTTRKYAMASTLPPYHSQRFLGCTIPTRAESFIVLAYWIISIILGAVNIHGFTGNVYWPAAPAQIWRYMADRTGTMSYGNIPIMWMFSGRNNIFIWLTGWSFGTFNVFHRHVARVATLQAIMHSIGYTFYFFTSGNGPYYYSDFASFWYAIGFVATVVMGFLVLFSFSFFRNKLYENFLLVHIVLSALLLVFLYYHTNIFDLELYNYPFLLSAVAIWGFDRFVRLVRQLYVNLHVRRNGFKRTKATVTYHAASNIISIDVIPGNARLFAGPGQHYFLYQPLRLLGWENHPFTLAHWTHEPGPASHAGDGDLHLKFWARPYDGWTKKLMKECLKKGGPAATISTPILLEGPYGHAEPTHTFEHVLLIAGGSGISGVLPYLLDHVRRTAKDASSPSGSRIPTRTRHITVLLVDRSVDFLRLLADGVLADAFGRADITVSLYNSRAEAAEAAASAAADANIASTASSSTDNIGSASGGEKTVEAEELSSEKGGVLSAGSGDSENASAEALKTVKDAARAYRIQPGRPDVLAVVRDMAQSIKGTESRLAVVVCGPNEIADNVRQVVADSMEKDRESIQYFEESFGW